MDLSNYIIVGLGILLTGLGVVAGLFVAYAQSMGQGTAPDKKLPWPYWATPPGLLLLGIALIMAGCQT